MIPSLSLHGRLERVYPQPERGIDLRGVVAVLVVADDPQPLFELGIGLWPTLLEHLVECPPQVDRGRTAVAAPIGIPQRPRVVSVHRCDDEFDALVGVVVAGDRAPQEDLRLWVALIVLDQSRVTLAVGF